MSRVTNDQMELFHTPVEGLPSHLVARPHEPVAREEFYRELDSQLAEAQRQGLPLSLITADINALKAVNDEIGHEEGDALIGLVESIVHTVAGTLRRRDFNRSADTISIEPIDYAKFEELEPHTKASTAARVGGDEFKIILPGTDEAGALVVVDRILEVAGASLAGPRGDEYRRRGINVGVAVGVATSGPALTNGPALLRASDQAMYANKMDQVVDLTPEQQEHLRASLAHLREANVRPRDLPRYVEWLGAQALLDAKLEDDNS